MSKSYLRSGAFFAVPFLVIKVITLAEERPENDKKPSAPVVSSTPRQTPTEHDGQHDFDFEIGTWRTHLWSLRHPLTDSTEWVESKGIVVVRKVWDGRANLVELVAEGPAGPFEFLNLRLYNPQTHQWSDYCHQQGRHLHQAHDRRVQEWPRRILLPRKAEWPCDVFSIPYMEHHPGFVSFRRRILRRSGQNLESERDRHGHTSER